MGTKNRDPLHQIAEQVADCLAESGYAFVEDDQIEGLAALLAFFLTVSGIPTSPPGTRCPDTQPYPIGKPGCSPS